MGGATTGHLFVVHGDLTQLACDGWLLPCDRGARPRSSWLRHLRFPQGFSWPRGNPAWKVGADRVLEVEGWRETSPRPWLVNVAAPRGTRVSWYVEGAAQFLARAEAATRHLPPRNGRARRLLALPVVGTGGGGAGWAAGHVLKELVPLLIDFVAEHDVDVALVTNVASTFAAAQVSRQSAGYRFAEVGERLRATAEMLAEHAARGDLVLFLGAGIGLPAGLPNWSGLLKNLAAEAGFEDPAALAALPLLDQARVIEVKLERKVERVERPLGAAVAAQIGAVQGYGLLHGLLASLPVREVVTTNYDQLFERAWEAIRKPLSVLPHAPRPGAPGWLLKMHGCVADPASIVLTREDYLRYDHRREALSGIVQALLITKHMLFVGFSLTDDNFHRIADAVRRARPVAQPSSGGSAPKTFGTALHLSHDPHAGALWGDEVDWVAMEAGTAALSSRRIEIFLDYLAAQIAPMTHLLDRRFEGALGETAKALRTSLGALLAAVEANPAAREDPAWPQVAALLERLGYSEFD